MLMESLVSISEAFPSIPAKKGGSILRSKMLRYEISLFSKKLHDFQSILSLEWHIISYDRHHHWFCLRRAMIAWCPPSVGPLPWFQTVCRLPSLTQLTLIAPVLPLAEWEFTLTWSSFSMACLSRVAGPPNPHEPQYSISTVFDIINDK